MIRGRRVSLRPVEESDFEAIRDWQNDLEVWWWQDYEKTFSIADIAEIEERARGEGHPFVIEVDGVAIGRIGLNNFRRRDRICSLYVFIGDPGYRGQGYGGDAMSTLLAYAFDRLDLHQVELWCLASNAGAIRAYEKVGFRHDATLRDRSWKDGAWHDRVIMSVQRNGLVADEGSGDEGAT
jgi:RimJ/RimL family protein N-acetyltransferase